MKTENNRREKQHFDNPAYQYDAEANSSRSPEATTSAAAGEKYTLTASDPEAVNVDLVHNPGTSSDRRVEFSTAVGGTDETYFMPRPISSSGKSFYPLVADDDEKMSARRRFLLMTMLLIAVCGLGILIGALVTSGDSGSNREQGLDGASASPLIADPDSMRDGRALYENEVWTQFDSDDGNRVRGALEGQVIITNYKFSQKLHQPESHGYKLTRMIVENALWNGLADAAKLSPEERKSFVVKIYEFFEGSIGVKFRISWSTLEDSKPLFTPDLAKAFLIYHLTLHKGHLGPYLVARSSIEFNHFEDVCLHGRGGCSHWCSFSTKSLKFKCMCPREMHVGTDGKTCARGVGLPDPEEAEAEPEPEPAASQSGWPSDNGDQGFGVSPGISTSFDSSAVIFADDPEDEEPFGSSHHNNLHSPSGSLGTREEADVLWPDMPWDTPENNQGGDLRKHSHTDVVLPEMPWELSEEERKDLGSPEPSNDSGKSSGASEKNSNPSSGVTWSLADEDNEHSVDGSHPPAAESSRGERKLDLPATEKPAEGSPEPEPSSEPEPAAEPKSEPEPESTVGTKSDGGNEAEPEAEPESEPEPTAKP